MADQTNAEVSDERLRELIQEAIRADLWPADIHAIVDAVNAASDANDMSTEQCIALGILLTRRSVTSQASEGEVARLREELNREQLAHDKTKCELRDAYDILATEASP